MKKKMVKITAVLLKITVRKWAKKGISAGFPIVQFPGDQKTALSGESLYL